MARQQSFWPEHDPVDLQDTTHSAAVEHTRLEQQPPEQLAPAPLQQVPPRHCCGLQHVTPPHAVQAGGGPSADASAVAPEDPSPLDPGGAFPGEASGPAGSSTAVALSLSAASIGAAPAAAVASAEPSTRCRWALASGSHAAPHCRLPSTPHADSAHDALAHANHRRA